MKFPFLEKIKNMPKPDWYGMKRAGVTSGRILVMAGGWAFRIFGTLFLVLLTTGTITLLILCIYLSRFLDIDTNVDLGDITLSQTSIIRYFNSETGEWDELETLHGNQNRIMAKYDEFPAHMIDALVAIEDRRFFQHKGVDWKRTGKAVQEMLTGSGGAGGSTITQQLIKNLTNEKDVTVQRKISEIFKALEFEKEHSKEEILEWYLNTSYFGSGCWGVKTAAMKYFGKELGELTPAESAAIIGITQYPTLYDPYLNPDKNKERQETILIEMFKQGKLAEPEYRQARAQKLVLARSRESSEDGDIQSYFVDQVFFEARDDLAERLAIPREMAVSLLYNAGYHIDATIDMRIQNIIDEVYADDANFPEVKNSEKPLSSILVMDPYTGAVLGIGQRGQKTGNLESVLPTMSQRPPGSSIKPVSVYSAAMDLGAITPYSVVDDAPLLDLGGRAWPKNSTNSYRGRTTVMTAVQNSVNTIAVRVVNTITPQRSFDFAYYTMGLKSLVDRREVSTSRGTIIQTDIDYSPMALGGVTRGLTVRELTAAYCSFPNKGIYNKPRTYSKITDASGKTVILDNAPSSSIVMKEKTAYYMNLALQEVVKGGTGTKAQFSKMTIAGKTGTTTDDKDRWFIGYTPYYAAGSWFGFKIPKKITLSSSTNPALTMWKLVMERVHEGLEPGSFFEPEGLAILSICLDSGMAPTDLCRLDPRGKRVGSGMAAREDVVKSPCNVHTGIDVCTETGRLATPYCPSVRQVGLLNLGRGMPVGGVVLSDEQYTARWWSPDGVTRPVIPEGSFYPVAVGPDGAPPYNTFCAAHTQAPPPEPDPELPPEPDPGENPGDGQGQGQGEGGQGQDVGIGPPIGPGGIDRPPPDDGFIQDDPSPPV